MIFDEVSKGTFRFDDASCSKFKMDTSLGNNVTKDKMKLQLLVELRMDGVNTTQRIFLKPELVTICESHNIPTTTTTQQIIPRWYLVSKGMLKILVKRG